MLHAGRCDNCTIETTNCHVLNIEGSDFLLCGRCARDTEYNGAALAAFFRKLLVRTLQERNMLLEKVEEWAERERDAYLERKSNDR